MADDSRCVSAGEFVWDHLAGRRLSSTGLYFDAARLQAWAQFAPHQFSTAAAPPATETLASAATEPAKKPRAASRAAAAPGARAGPLTVPPLNLGRALERAEPGAAGAFAKVAPEPAEAPEESSGSDDPDDGGARGGGYFPGRRGTAGRATSRRPNFVPALAPIAPMDASPPGRAPRGAVVAPISPGDGLHAISLELDQVAATERRRMMTEPALAAPIHPAPFPGGAIGGAGAGNSAPHDRWQLDAHVQRWNKYETTGIWRMPDGTELDNKQ